MKFLNPIKLLKSRAAVSMCGLAIMLSGVTIVQAAGPGGGASGAAANPPRGSLSKTVPANVVGGYWQMWNGPLVSDITASAPQYNLHYAAFAMGSDRKGRVAFNPVFQSGTSLKNDIAASKASGATWLLSLGGGSDSTIRLTTSAQADTMLSSLVPIIDQYGFQGVDFDFECGTTCFSPSAGVRLADLLKQRYGSNFIISATPRPYEVRSSNTVYAQFALQAGNSLDILGLQFYDFPEANDATQLANMVDSDLASLHAMGIPMSKVLIGAITYSGYQYGHNTVDVYKNIYQTQKVKYPALRGVFAWELSYDKLENWSFAQTMGAAVRGL